MPSEVLRIKDEYTSFCFDEACMYIIEKLENKEEPRFIESEIDQTTGKRKTFLDEHMKEGAK
jgi:hypothetical protein